MKVFNKAAFLAYCLLAGFLLVIPEQLSAQNTYPASGNATINGLTVGKYFTHLSGDPQPFNIFSPHDSGIHDLILFGNTGTATLNLRLYDGSLKLGRYPNPNAEILNNGAAYFLGNVGIGTTTPTQKLTVNGTTKTKEVIVEENVGADFVFDDDYFLPSLSEIEQHIKSKKHLPEIPSAAQMIANGVKVGELQMKLLAKIEELTLYVIEMEKRDREKEERIKELERKLDQKNIN